MIIIRITATPSAMATAQAARAVRTDVRARTPTSRDEEAYLQGAGRILEKARGDVDGQRDGAPAGRWIVLKAAAAASAYQDSVHSETPRRASLVRRSPSARRKKRQDHLKSHHEVASVTAWS